MKKYTVLDINLPADELKYFHSIGIDVGEEITVDENKNYGMNICIIGFENSSFCIRREVLNFLTLEEIK